MADLLQAATAMVVLAIVLLSIYWLLYVAPNLDPSNPPGGSVSSIATTIAPASTLNYTNGSLSGNYPIAVNLSQELNNSANGGLYLNKSAFASSSYPACAKVLISSCDNNVPSQFLCVGAYYADEVTQEAQGADANKPHVCPMFVEAGSIACGVSAGYCVVTDSRQP